MADIIVQVLGRPKESYRPTYLSDEEIETKGFDIIEHLEGIPLGHALYILENTKKLLLDCHTVDSDCDQFFFRVNRKRRESSIPDQRKV